MKALWASMLILICAAGVTASAQTTKPGRYTWIATSCDTWNCAAGTLVLAGGDKHVIVLPTGQEDRPWLILRRVEEGAIYIPDDEPFGCEVFHSVPLATSHFSALDACHAPIILNVPDGRAVVVSLRKCGTENRRRAMR